MATAVDLITDALFEISVLAAGETPSAADAAFGLRTLNRLVNAWKAERVFLYSMVRTTWTIAASDGEYTVGSGLNVNISRPAKIDRIKYYDSTITPIGEIDLPLMTDAEWSAIPDPTATSTYPAAAYYNLTYPSATIHLYPVPTGTTLVGVLYCPGVISEFSGLTTSVSLPPGYERMITKVLAVELAPGFGAPVSPELREQARDSMATVMRSNKRLVQMTFDPGALTGGGGGSYDIYTDH